MSDFVKDTNVPTNDIISRQAAIDVLAIGEEFLKRVLDSVDVVGYERKKYEWGLDLIESYILDMRELPSAQPEPCEDAVSRQAIFDTAAEYEKQLCEILGDENELVEVVEILKHRLIALPSAQPEKRMETHACDLIDREAAVDAIYHHLPSVSRTRARTMLHEVPSAQPEIIRCKDCKWKQ